MRPNCQKSYRNGRGGSDGRSYRRASVRRNKDGNVFGSSIIRFIEDNWLEGERIGQGSYDAFAGSLLKCSTSTSCFRFCGHEAGRTGWASGRPCRPQHDPKDKTRQAILLLSRALTTCTRGPATVDAVTVAVAAFGRENQNCDGREQSILPSSPTT
jgi:hypothetical protein